LKFNKQYTVVNCVKSFYRSSTIPTTVSCKYEIEQDRDTNATNTREKDRSKIKNYRRAFSNKALLRKEYNL